MKEGYIEAPDFTRTWPISRNICQVSEKEREIGECAEGARNRRMEQSYGELREKAAYIASSSRFVSFTFETKCTFKNYFVVCGGYATRGLSDGFATLGNDVYRRSKVPKRAINIPTVLPPDVREEGVRGNDRGRLTNAWIAGILRGDEKKKRFIPFRTAKCEGSSVTAKQTHSRGVIVNCWPLTVDCSLLIVK